MCFQSLTTKIFRVISDYASLFRSVPPDFTARSFVVRAHAGEFEGQDLEEVIDDAIGAWHSSESPLTLHEYLGFSWEEYSAWVENSSLEEILQSRNTGHLIHWGTLEKLEEKFKETSSLLDHLKRFENVYKDIPEYQKVLQLVEADVAAEAAFLRAERIFSFSEIVRDRQRN